MARKKTKEIQELPHKDKVSFVIDLKVNSKWGLNSIYAGKHWAVRKKKADEIHELVYWTMRELNIKKELFQRPVGISISYNSKLDIHNHGYLSKMIVDGLKGYLIQDDTRKFVKELRQSFWDDLGVLVEVWEV